MTQRALGDAGEEVDEHHVGIECDVCAQRSALVAAVERVVIVVYAESDLRQRGVVVALEGVKVVGAHLRGTVAAPKVVLEEDRHLLHHRSPVVACLCGNLQGGYEVFLAVGAHLADG